MRSSFIATILAAAIAGIFVFVTEPIAGAKSGIPEHPSSGISKPAAKGDRLDLRPEDGCSLAPDQSNYGSDCVRVVDRWRIRSSPQSAAA